MITVGLVKELHFIAARFDTQLTCILSNLSFKSSFLLTINANHLTVHYNNQIIWEEDIVGAATFFGIESCDTIARIATCIDNGTDWSDHRWNENLDFLTKPS